MFKNIFLIAISFFLFLQEGFSQKKGIVPLTGLQFFEEGISAPLFSFKINGQQLYGNRIPTNQDIEISFQQPAGFLADNKKKYFAAIEYSLVSDKGVVLVTKPNLLEANVAGGFTLKELKLLSGKFNISEKILQPNAKATIRIRLYDLKKSNQLRLEYPISISYPRETIWLTNSVQTLKSPAGSLFMVNSLKAKSLSFSVDTSIKAYPKMAYLSLDISKIEGSSMVAFMQGKEYFWVYDTAYKEIKIKEILLKSVEGSMESSNVDCTVKIPFRLKTDKRKGYIIRYRWESADKKQVMDIVVTN